MPAYYDEEEDFAVSSPGSRRGRSAVAKMTTLAGAGLAVALILGAGLWVFSVGTRDAGDVPLIRAAEETAKVRPDDPGGEVTPHQDISAYESSVQPDGTVVVAHAPSTAEIAEEDLPMGQLGAAPPPPTATATEPGPREAERTPPAQVAALTTIEGEDVDEEFVEPPKAESLIQSEVELLSARRPRRRIIPHVADPVPPKGEGSAEAPAYAPVVALRPRDLAARFAAAGAKAEDNAMALVRRAQQSKIQIQLGAYPERATIEEEWRRISQANSDVLEGRTLAIQQTNSGGVTYFRLRVGPFRSGHEANTVCQALKARGHDCLVAINTDRRG